jgi:hypothetical protein
VAHLRIIARSGTPRAAADGWPPRRAVSALPILPAGRCREYRYGVAHDVSNLTFRRLEQRDLNCLFNLNSRHIGEEWLERQARGEVHVGVAELAGLPVACLGW